MANQERVGCTSSIFFIIVGFSKYFSLTIICEYILVKIYNVFLGNIKKREIHSRVPLLSSQSILSEPSELGGWGGGIGEKITETEVEIEIDQRSYIVRKPQN